MKGPKISSMLPSESNPREKLDSLKESLNSGLISNEEYQKSKIEVEAQIARFEEKQEKRIKENQENDVKEEQKIYSEKSLIIGIVVLLVLFFAVFAYFRLFKEKPQTIEDLHLLNLKNKLKPEQGYVYKGVYSFITLDDVWYTQLKSPKGTRVFNLALRYSPKDLESIDIEGNLDKNFFDEKQDFYVTFNPEGGDFSHISLAVADFDTHMTKVFDKLPVASCDRNSSIASKVCEGRPIVTCDDSDKLVVYFKESPRLRAYYNKNCIVVEGSSLDFVKGIDRILYNLYGIMEQKEK